MNSILTRIVGWFRPARQIPQTPEPPLVYTDEVTDSYRGPIDALIILQGVINWQIQTIRVMKTALCARRHPDECDCEEFDPIAPAASIRRSVIGNRHVVTRLELAGIIEATIRYCAERLEIVEVAA